jgi:hypothetical protein
MISAQVGNRQGTDIEIIFRDDYLAQMNAGFERTDWAHLAETHGAYAVEKPWKYVREIAQLLLDNELPDCFADYYCVACDANLLGAAEADTHHCG